MIRRSWMKRPARVELLLFGVIFATSAFFSEIAYQSSNYTARLFLTQAIVDQGSFRLDAYRDTLGVDGSVYDGHIYSSKPLGSSLMMLPQYLIIGKPVHFILGALNLSPSVQNQQYDTTAVFIGWLVQIFSLALYTAIAFVILYRIFELVGIQNRRLPLTLLSYFGTLMFAYATIGTGEMFTVPPLLLGIYFLLKSNPMAQGKNAANSYPEPHIKIRSYFFAGLFFAFAFFTTNQIALIIIVALIAISWQEHNWRPVFFFALPIAISLLLTLLYNWVNFDSPFSFPIQFWEMGSPEQLRLEWPTLGKLAEMSFLPWKGIFFYSPYLILAIPGYWQLYRRSKDPLQSGPVSTAMVFFLSGSFILYFLYLVFNMGWYGGADFGFRYIVPVLPFLCIGAAVWLSGRKLSPIEYTLLIISIVFCSFGALTDPEVPSNIRNPLLDYNWPMFVSDATNNVPNFVAHQLLGIRHWAMRLFTSALFFISLIWLLWRTRYLWFDSILSEK
jgi:hypothetical protein